MAYNPRDHYFKKAKAEKFAARSVYKLEEIDQRFRILRKGDVVLDLGCAPGSWSQYAARVVGPSGKIIGVDLKPVSLRLEPVEFVQDNVLTMNWPAFLAERGLDSFNVVLSDMAPQTTGIRLTDQARSFELCEMALRLATQLLRPGGHFVCKLFHSADFAQLKKSIQTHFRDFEAPGPISEPR